MMERMVEEKARAYIYQPGDGTRYYMVVTTIRGFPQVAVLNEHFSDIITPEANGGVTSLRGKNTNPWTVKAAKDLIKEFLIRDSEQKTEGE